MKTNILVLFGLIVWLSSCTEKHLIKYNETKVFPITAEITESSKTVLGDLDANRLKKLFDIPSDGRVESFSIMGMNLVVEKQSGTEADLISYRLVTEYELTDENKIIDTLLSKANRDMGVFGVNSFNVTSELNPRAVKSVEGNIRSLLINENKFLNYVFSVFAFDFGGKEKKFVGKVTGQLSIQVVYSVCESFPEGLFSEYPKCQ